MPSSAPAKVSGSSRSIRAASFPSFSHPLDGGPVYVMRAPGPPGRASPPASFTTAASRAAGGPKDQHRRGFLCSASVSLLLASCRKSPAIQWSVALPQEKVSSSNRNFIADS